MLRWSLIFFLIAMIAGALGYTEISGAALDIGKILFIVFLIPAVLLLVAGLFIFKPR